ncbi:restriction endonuclease [Micromonospora tarensis]|uniref:Restriction endonuclease n=1 Tax=Micromonospora tarensis TaxID=2806100 RepID=A0ABS1YC97_9ACTN|nr:restriction endonuclease [Micromonospora tarensis]MBM0275029.1 restriction endonuclease [Micromonospora tarensis]
MTPGDQSGRFQVLAEQRALWRRQASAIPGLLGGKAVWLPLVLELVKQVGEGRAIGLDAKPELSFDIESVERRQGGAAPRLEPATWRDYYGFLRGLQLVENTAGELRLTATGSRLQSEPTPARLAVILADRIRLFAEVLSLIAGEPLTLDEVDERIRARYKQSWKSKGNTRSRMDWQEVLGLIEAVGNRRWGVTAAGRAVLAGRVLVGPDAFDEAPGSVVELPDAPAEIAALLADFSTSARTHESRNTYNIWVPCPPSHPNKVENLRTIMNAALGRIERGELFSFIGETFELRSSSTESMLPFLRASGLLVEVGRGVFEATPAARAWVESGEDLNFVRILHANMRFVGEMIRAVEDDVTRNDMYSEAAKYGLNVDKCRWIASFLLNTELIEEPRYGSLRATPRGVALAAELPLADPPSTPHERSAQPQNAQPAPDGPQPLQLRQHLIRLSREPLAGGEGAGRAFEKAIRDAFLAMGFEARTVGGSGDTDILVQWHEADGSPSTAIIEAKARSAGQVTHTDVSDVAIETHKERHHAGFIAIVGPAFSGDTMKNMASQKKWVLLDADRLGALAEASIALGLRPYEIGQLFLVPNGLADLDDLIADRRRELDIVSFLLSKLVEEESEAGEAISARDISRDGRRTELRPSVEEIVDAITVVSSPHVGALRLVDPADDPKFATYVLGDAPAGARRLRALADAIDRLPGEAR